ncbi:MAG: hypothetical protein MUF85_00905 [Patescibacteria group bacterium]|jgi:hypothetical protein|nr:hypothetical protein [Patescibacteria group bacterium]
MAYDERRRVHVLPNTPGSVPKPGQRDGALIIHDALDVKRPLGVRVKT